MVTFLAGRRGRLPTLLHPVDEFQARSFEVEADHGQGYEAVTGLPLTVCGATDCQDCHIAFAPGLRGVAMDWSL
jgi:hypothetical protein